MAADQVSGLKYVPPWTEPYIIGIAGSSGSGKTVVASQIVKALNVPWAVILSFDNFYRPLTWEQRQLAFKSEYDFDAPEALDFDLLVDCMQKLKEGKKTEIPLYSFEQHNRLPETTTIYAASVIIVEGIFALYDKRMVDMMDLKVFVDTDLDVCMARRLQRDISSRGRDIEGALKQWFAYVKPNFEQYMRPTGRVADVVLPRGLDNKVALGMLIKHIQRTLLLKSQQHLEQLDKLGKLTVNMEELMATNVTVLKQGTQVAGMHTILLDRATSREDFAFYFERLMLLLIETAMCNMKYETRTVPTPTGLPYEGLAPTMDTCAVTILRGGACFETSLRRLLPAIAIGKILIQSEAMTGEPRLHYLKLPPRIEEQFVLLVDSQATTGTAAIMAICVLLDHGVREDNICFVTYLADRRIAVKRILAAYPKVKIVVGKVEDNIRRRFIDTKYFGS
ncbi:uridine kinase family-domain-containing protein [Dipodascopsis tothii]|uniref:uridine kinase family-domain-containing protein n=1 Tax=Dipodascopsis tothii TaxID=44089 RepID=UPI0034CE526C